MLAECPRPEPAAQPADHVLLQPHELVAFDRLDAEAAIRTRVQNAFLGNNGALTGILGRYKLFVDTRDEGFGSHVLLDGYREIWLTLFAAAAQPRPAPPRRTLPRGTEKHAYTKITLDKYPLI